MIDGNQLFDLTMFVAELSSKIRRQKALCTFNSWGAISLLFLNLKHD